MTRKLILAAMATAVLAPAALAQNTTTTTRQATGAQPAVAQPAGAQAGQAQGKAAVSDPLFATVAGASGLAEVAISRLGAQRATDEDLKKFSQQMIEDHTRANQELMTLAGQKRLAIPVSLDPKAEFCAQSLAGLSGDEFNRCYAKAQLVAHMEAVANFEAEAQRGQDPDVKAWAAKTLPKIKDHLKMIKPIAMKYDKDKADDDRSEHKDK